MKFVTENAGKKPFFLYVPFNAVHSPHQVPPEYMKPYEANLKGERLKYAGMLAAMDEAVGQIVDAVEKAGVRRNTLFVFSSDNGGPQPGVVTDNGKFRAGKGTLYEGGVRVAAFATWDGHIKAGTTITEPLHMVDWYPTLLKLCGAKVEQKLPIDGLDIWPTLTQGKPSPHDAILINTTPEQRGCSRRRLEAGREERRRRPGRRRRRRRTDTASVELFNLKDDPYEKTNLADKHADKVKELKDDTGRVREASGRRRSRSRSPQDFVTPKVWGEKD